MGTFLENKRWWLYIEHDLQELLKQSYFLADVVQSWGVDLPGGKKKFHDYSFVIFPAAKAYEGFLKKVFLDMGFITQDDYYGKHFRIGKSLNPSLPSRLRKEEVYTKIVKYAGSSVLADHLWETWKAARNLTFHWFPNEKNAITFEEAKKDLEMIVKAFDMLYDEMSSGV